MATLKHSQAMSSHAKGEAFDQIRADAERNRPEVIAGELHALSTRIDSLSEKIEILSEQEAETRRRLEAGAGKGDKK